MCILRLFFLKKVFKTKFKLFTFNLNNKYNKNY